MSDEAWQALLNAAGFDRLLLDRLLLDGEAPLRCEVERVAGALGRVATWSSLPRLRHTTLAAGRDEA